MTETIRRRAPIVSQLATTIDACGFPSLVIVLLRCEHLLLPFQAPPTNTRVNFIHRLLVISCRVFSRVCHLSALASYQLACDHLHPWTLGLCCCSFTNTCSTTARDTARREFWYLLQDVVAADTYEMEPVTPQLHRVDDGLSSSRCSSTSTR